jgi:PAS domain S-box-containing protein
MQSLPLITSKRFFYQELNKKNIQVKNSRETSQTGRTPKQKQKGLGESKLSQPNKSTWDDRFYKDFIEIVREPVLALDSDLRVVFTNRSFNITFKFTARETIGNLIYDLGNRQWDIPKLHSLLEEIIPKHNLVNGFQIEPEFPTIGKRILLLNARRITNSLENKRLILLTIEDITDRIHREPSLQASNEDRYHELFNHINICVAVYEAVENGRDFIFKDFNAAAEKTERTPRKKVIGRKVTEVFPGIREMGLLSIFQKVWKTGNPEHHPISIYKDQRLVGWRENYVYKLPSAEIVSSYEDATERKQQEQALRQNEEKFKRMVTTSQEGIWMTNAKKDIIFANERIAAMLGYSVDELLHHKSTDFIFKEDRDDYNLRMNSRTKGVAETYERRTKHKNGSALWTIISTSPLFNENGEFEGAFAMITDITKRKKMEVALRDSETKMRSLFASMKDLVIIYNKEGRYLNIAITDSQLSNRAADGLLGKTIHEVFPKEEADRWVSHIQTVLEMQRTMPIEYCLEIDHHKAWFNASVSPMNKDTVIWVARDITDRKLMEEKSYFIGTHDNLTKLYNRTFYQEELVRLEKSRLFPVSIFIIDVDGLKTINDTQGHAAGDILLQRTAQVLQKSFRPEDLVARIGGGRICGSITQDYEENCQISSGTH